MLQQRLNLCLSEISKGDIGYFREIYDAVYDDLYKYVFFICRHKELTEDIVQETFAKVLQNASAYRKQKNSRAWIFTIAHNELMSFFRKQKMEVVTDIYSDQGEVASFESDCINSITLGKALQNLSEMEREIVLLHIVSGLRFREISDALNMPLGTVTGAFRRAISKLKTLLL